MTSNLRFLWTSLVFAVAVLLALPGLAFAAEVPQSDAVASATVGGSVKYYDNLREAVDQAEDGSTVTVLKSHEIDCTNPSQVYVTDGYKYAEIVVESKDVTLDLNGKALTACPTTNVILFASESGGHMTLIDGAGGGSVMVDPNGTTVFSLMICCDGSSSFTVNAGSYWIDNATDALAYVSYTKQGDNKVYGTFSINGGSFHLENVGSGDNGIPWIFNAKSQNQGHVLVNGGTFNADVLHQYYPFEVSAPKSRALRNNGDGTWTMVDAVAYVTEREKSGNWYTNEIGYASLKEAVAAVDAVGSGSDIPEDIYLLEDCEVYETILVDKAFTLYLQAPGAAEPCDIIWKGDRNHPVIFSSEDYDGVTMTIKVSEDEELSGTEPEARDGYTYKSCESFDLPNGQTLFVAEPNEYTVAFDTNGGEGTAMADMAFIYDESQTLTPNAFTREGYIFAGWSKDRDADEPEYADKAIVKNLSTVHGDTVTLYAVWKPISYTVKFDASGGEGAMSDMSFEYDESKTLTDNAFTRKGYTFIGWNTEADFSGTTFEDKSSVSNLTAVDGNSITLYAMWEKGVPPVSTSVNKGPLAATGDTSAAAAVFSIMVCSAIAVFGVRRLKA